MVPNQQRRCVSGRVATSSNVKKMMGRFSEVFRKAVGDREWEGRNRRPRISAISSSDFLVKGSRERKLDLLQDFFFSKLQAIREKSRAIPMAP